MLQHSILKKFKLFILLIILHSSAFSQKSHSSSKYAGIANIAITKEEARRYINTFKDIFKKTAGDIRTLEDSFYVDFNFIQKFTLMLEKKSNNYNGLRFVLSTDENTDMQKLFFVPTRKISGSTENINAWALLPNTTGCEFKNYNVLGITKARRMENKFKTYHRGEETSNKRDSLSKSVWMSREVMQYIRDTIKNHPGTGLDKLVGVRIFNACYPIKMTSIPGMDYLKQSTVVIVFMKKDINGNLYECWDFNEGVKEQILAGNNIIFNKDVLNHGELCPSRCGD
jgi:hypothetical protein